MKKLILSTCFAAILQGIAHGQNLEFADPNFQAYLLAEQNINVNGDEYIQLSEAINYSGAIGLKQSNIKDLSGIEHFVNLRELYIDHNQIKTLDLSKNTKLKRLVCNNNEITSLDLSEQSELDLLVCNNNKITSLKLAPNHKLEKLFAHENLIDELDLGASTVLTDFWLEANQLNTIDLKPFKALTSFIIKGGLYNTLDISQNTKLEHLSIYEANHLQHLDLSKNTAITILDIDAPLQDLNIDNLKDLSALALSNNPIHTLNILTNTKLENLTIHNTSIENIDFSKAKKLRSLTLENTPLKTLNINNNSNLEYCFLRATALKNLDFSEQSFLKNLVLIDNVDIARINISKNKNLQTLSIENSPIEYIDLSNNKALHYIGSIKTKLKYLDLSQNVLKSFNIINNEDLQWVNIANKSNKKIEYFHLKDNHNLHCFQVDDADFSNNNWRDMPYKNEQNLTFNDNCNIAFNSKNTISMLYPNPSKDIINLESKSDINIEILHINGALIRREKLKAGSNKINIENLSTGTYIIKVNKSESLKFIKA